MPNDVEQIFQEYQPGFVIEVFLVQKKAPPYPGLMLLWYSTGNMEYMLYACPQCDAILPPDYETVPGPDKKTPYVKCLKCKAFIPDEGLKTSIGFRWGVQRLSAEIAHWFYQTERQAGIRLRRYKSQKDMKEALKHFGTSKYTDLLREARSSGQEQVFYSNERIMEDIGGSGDVVNAIKKFLSA